MRDKKNTNLVAQLFKFNAIGLVNTAIDFALFTLLLIAGLGSFGAQVISYAAGTTNSYIMNKTITFPAQVSAQERRFFFNIRQFMRFAALNLGVLSLSLVLLSVLISVVGLPPLLSKLIVTIVTISVNFVGSRKWVFTERAYLNEKLEA
ncbi:GtrA family protein [Paenibacillus lentus]|uniref:GtrA family protein n=1 Tax=Paenibacillus lentus TaxID=1338368 RepID=A0A3S8S0I5_9BACL|nr:GtrA family protein [Paenibacillus lentus]AZK48771.1 GtrA family protein [Paenibacillus lentus]